MASESSFETQALSPQQALSLAVEKHNAGQLAEAETLYRQTLKVQPDNADALHLLGVLADQSGNPVLAEELITKAIALRPDFADALSNLGNVLKKLGKAEDAVDMFQKALGIQPQFPMAHSNLGNALMELGRYGEAVESHQKALDLQPAFPMALNNMGSALAKLERWEDAAGALEKALELQPDYAEALSNLGNVLAKLGRLEDAVTSHQKAISINPGNARAHNNLGSALLDLNQLDDAENCFNKAIALDQGFADAYDNLGFVFSMHGRFGEAMANHQKALSLKPESADAHANLGNTLSCLGRLDEAMDSYNKALAIQPDHVWAGRNLLYVILNKPGLTPKALFSEHVRFVEIHTRDIVKPVEDLANDPAPERRIRVGYLSSDFRDHPVGNNIYPLLSSHDRTNFEVFCYANVLKPDEMTERFRSTADHWRSVLGKSDSEVAGMVRADEIDVLVCLAGRFDKNRPLVCAHRAAPVQVSMFDGATSGLKEMDYWLTDGFLHPDGTQEIFTEELYRLPVLYQWPPIADAPAVKALPAEQAGTVTFGAFNNPKKISEEVIRLWADVLKAVPGSRLQLKFKNWYGQAPLCDCVTEWFAAGGIGQDRLGFAADLETLDEHLERYGGVDIALDTFPFNGATTTFQSLWMGVPVVSLAGGSFISRMSGSILHQVGLGDLAVDTPEAFVTTARDLAGDLARLKSLRAGLRERMRTSPLCNAPAYTGSVEAAIRDMWRTWCAGQ